MECRSEYHKYTGMFRGVLWRCDFRILLFRFCIYVLFKIYDIYVIAREGVKFGINFTSCCENDNEIARGTAKCYFAVIATTSGIYPKISLLPVYCRTQNVSGHFNLANYSESILSLTFQTLTIMCNTNIC